MWQLKYRVRPSADRLGPSFQPGPLMSGPRLTGSVHSQASEVSSSAMVIGAGAAGFSFGMFGPGGGTGVVVPFGSGDSGRNREATRLPTRVTPVASDNARPAARSSNKRKKENAKRKTLLLPFPFSFF